MEYEYELEVTVNSMNVGTQVYYFPLDQLAEGMKFVALRYGHYDQWSVVITRVFKRDK